MKFYVLTDNNLTNNFFEYEHGFSIFIELDNFNILFDSGQSDVFIKNAQKLNLDLNNVNAIVLSHGDYDHANGLKHLQLNRRVPLFCHPFVFNNRISKRRGTYAGINQTKNQLNKKFDVCLSTTPTLITNNVYFLGEINRDAFLIGGLPMLNESNNTYLHLDDSGIVINTEKGIIVVSGCAHSGICNLIEQAKKITKNNKIYAVIGGFHLKEIDNKTNEAIKYFIENNVQKIYLAHCTENIVCDEFFKHFKNSIKIEVGKSYEL